MYLEKAIFHNRAPFEHMELDFIKNGVNVLCAVNGKGKTTILSHLVDAFHEMTRPYYSTSYEGKENKFYRVSSTLYSIEPSKASWVYLRFRHDDQYIDYFDCRGIISEEDYTQHIIVPQKIDYRVFIDELKETACIKQVSKNFNKSMTKTIFDNQVCTYFPAYRYELPNYLNPPYKTQLEFSKDFIYDGNLINPLEVCSNLSIFANWIMDVLLDREIYKKVKEVVLRKGKREPIYEAPEYEVSHNLNTLLQHTLSSKKYDGYVRFGIGRRSEGAQRISIMEDFEDGTMRQISPSIFSLSSGEVAILCMFGEILRQADKQKNNIHLSEIKGIILIDEVEKHLHMKLQNEILPKLFNLFPNIQFIVSTHSPFFNMGLAHQMIDKAIIFDLDRQGKPSLPTTNKVFEDAYEAMIDEHKRIAYALMEIVKEFNKPVVITEGKTDIKHILKAKEKLGINDIEFATVKEDNQPSGDGDLLKILKQLSKMRLPNDHRPVIGIFDCDSNTTSEIQKADTFTPFGNNVYAFCIKAPQSRLDNGETDISIEFLYKDEEIKSNLPKAEGRRLFISNEFSSKTGRHKIETQLSLHNAREINKPRIKILESTSGQGVYDEKGNNLLATKNDFADAIVNEQIEISTESWENFKHIFNTIREIINEESNP